MKRILNGLNRRFDIYIGWMFMNGYKVHDYDKKMKEKWQN